MADDARRRSIEAAEAERSRWARELHDDTLQELAAVRLSLAHGARGTGAEELRAVIERAAASLDGQIAALRALITDLRPAALGHLGPASALESLVQRMAERGLDVRLVADLAHEEDGSAARYAPELEHAIYRIAQEALTNALLHGRATHAAIVLTEHSGAMELTVTDDGCGFDPTCHTSGFGLLSMRERAALLGGGLAIRSSPGAGTVVRAVLPVAPAIGFAGAPDACPDLLARG